jgi:hypothetical protein
VEKGIRVRPLMNKKVKKPIRSLRSGWFLIFSSPSLPHPHPQLSLFFLAHARERQFSGNIKLTASTQKNKTLLRVMLAAWLVGLGLHILPHSTTFTLSLSK